MGSLSEIRTNAADGSSPDDRCAALSRQRKTTLTGFCSGQRLSRQLSSAKSDKPHSAALSAVLAVIVVVLIEIRRCRLHPHVCPRSRLWPNSRRFGQHRRSIRICSGALGKRRSLEAQHAAATYDGRYEIGSHNFTPYCRYGSAPLFALHCPGLEG